MTRFYHDSWNPACRAPGGAQPCGTRVTLRARTDGERVWLRLWQAGETLVEMAPEGAGWFRAEVELPEEPGLLWYRFRVEDRCYGCQPDGLGGEGCFGEDPPSYQITCYRRDFTVPRWFGRRIAYQIFVDRFYNPLPQPLALPEGARFHRDWSETPCWQGEGNAPYEPNDFFGGNLWGVIAKLPYLQSLGVGTLYLNPIFEARSNHKYDTGSYERVDRGFGGDEAFASLCQEAERRGIRVLLDGVFSHTGADSQYFNRQGRYDALGAYQSPQSPYYPWYTFTGYPDRYRCWWDVPTLPELNELEPTCLAYLATGPEAIAKRWLRRGAKGWRLDVADELPDEFLLALRRAVKEEDPEALLLGEVWEDASRKESYGHCRPFLWGEALDSVMNYPLRRALLDYLLLRNGPAETVRRIRALQEHYPPQAFYSLLNLMGSHDRPRALTALAGAPEPDGLTREQMAAVRPGPGELAMAKQRLKLLSLALYALPGAPCIYYGDEAGMEGMGDPFCRGAYPWGREDGELVAWFRGLGALRNGAEPLLSGHCEAMALDGALCIRRWTGPENAWGEPAPRETWLCLINPGAEARELTLPGPGYRLRYGAGELRGNRLLLAPRQGCYLWKN